MNGIDRLFLRSISESIKNEIDNEKIFAMQQKLEGEMGIGFEDLVPRFEEMKKNLHEIGNVLNDIEDKVLHGFLEVETHGKETWLVVKNRHLTEMILRAYADEDKTMILNMVRENPDTTPNILAACKIPNTSAYRKMNQLISEGFIVPMGLAETFEGKRAILYKSAINRMQIHVEKNSIKAKILLTREMLKSSTILATMIHINAGYEPVSN